MWRVSTFPPVLISPYNIDPPIIIATMEREREKERERGARVEVLKDVKGEMSRGERSTRVDARRVEGRRKEREGRQEALYIRITFVLSLPSCLTLYIL